MHKVKIILAICLAISGTVIAQGCATSHEDVAEHHHHPKAEFEGKCAYSVMNSNFDVPGKPEFSLDHNAVTYYFSSKEARDKFSQHIDESAAKATSAWREPRHR